MTFFCIDKNNKNSRCLNLKFDIDDNYHFSYDIETALEKAEKELNIMSNEINENLDSIKNITSKCDKIDYTIAMCCGVICGVVDVFLVGNPKESIIGNVTDEWFKNRTIDFAKICGWNSNRNKDFCSAVRYLEKKFKIPYDQRGAGDAASEVFELNPKNHHFKSLSHNPTIMGLFFSIIDQFTNTSHFISDGELISLQEADNSFKLCGKNILSKLFAGIINWFGHLVSDLSGSSSSKGRGTGIPSPFLSWTNELIVVKRKLNISITEFDKLINDLAIQIYQNGYDVRFQTAQAIPVFINELLVRFFYSLRRIIKSYYISKNINLLDTCKCFDNATVKRMITVAHATFCLIDIGDSLKKGIKNKGNLSVNSIVMSVNIVGIGRLSISLYGEVKRKLKKINYENEKKLLERNKFILHNYIESLKQLADIYDDGDLLLFTEKLEKSDMYIKAFNESVGLAKKRSVPENKILKNKKDIDLYFRGERGNENKK